MTRGAEPYNADQDQLAVANRKALGKAERNACIRCVPRPIVKTFLQLLTDKTGLEAVEDSDVSPATESADANPPGDLTYEQVLDRAGANGLDQESFEIKVLGKTLEGFKKIKGSSPEVADKKLTEFLERPTSLS